MGVKYSQGEINQGQIQAIIDSLDAAFNSTPVLLIAPLLIIAMVIFKAPALPGLFAGSMLGGVFAFVFQKMSIIDIIDSMHYGIVMETGNEMVDNLVSGGGLDGMMWTTSLIICAMMFGGIMDKTEMIKAIAAGLLKFVTKTGDLVLATITTSFCINLIGDQYLSIVIPGRMYKDEYEKMGLEARLLSRTLEDGGTLSSPLIPWNACGAYMIGVLGLSPWTYVPYCFLNLINPVIAVVLAYTGFKIIKKKPEEILADVASE